MDFSPHWRALKAVLQNHGTALKAVLLNSWNELSQFEYVSAENQGAFRPDLRPFKLLRARRPTDHAPHGARRYPLAAKQ
jgi:hypothetical protein